jgi:hypothetical protein
MGLILDSSILIADERGRFDLTGFLRQFPGSQPVIAAVTASELLHGVERAVTAGQKARHYKDLSGKPLGITGEVAEFEAARRLGLELADARSSGYDAKKKEADSEVLIQIKGRSYPRSTSDSGQRIGKIDFTKKWDAVVLVLMDEDFEVKEIIQASRKQIEDRLKSLPVNEDGKQTHTQKDALTVPLFRSIAKQK